MAEQNGAAWGAAGHDAAQLVAPLITPDMTTEQILEAYHKVKEAIYERRVDGGASSGSAGVSTPASSGGGDRPTGGDVVINGQGDMAGMTIREAYGVRPGYVKWMATKFRNPFMKAQSIKFITEELGMQPEDLPN